MNFWKPEFRSSEGTGMTITEYKHMLISDILEWQTRNQFTEDELKKKSTRVLEIIHDNVD